MQLRLLPLLLLLITAPAAFGADPTPEKVFGWLSLRGDSVPTRYTPGSLDRAANVQWRLEIVMKALGRAGVKIDGINLYLASPEEWVASGCARPYGLPETFGSTLMLPAWGMPFAVFAALLFGLFCKESALVCVPLVPFARAVSAGRATAPARAPNCAPTTPPQTSRNDSSR